MKYWPNSVWILLLLAAAMPVRAQLCGAWSVSIEVVDTKGKPVENASVEYVSLPTEDPASRHPFSTLAGSPNVLASRFIEGERTSVIYELLIKAAGYKDLHTVTKITYCHSTQERKVLLRSTDPEDVAPPGSSSFCMYFINEKDAVVPGAIIELTPDPRLSTGRKYKFVTDDKGKVKMEILNGLYTVEVNTSGYTPLILRDRLYPDEARPDCQGYELIAKPPKE